VDLAGREGQNCSWPADPFSAGSPESKQPRFDDAHGPGVVKMWRVPHRKVICPEGIESAAGEFNPCDDRRGVGTEHLRQSITWVTGEKRIEG
jgi:hypothetical protein